MGMDSPEHETHYNMLRPPSISTDVFNGGCDSFTSDRSSVHDLILGDSVVFVVHTRTGAGCLTFDDVDLHVFYLNPHQQEVDLAHDDIFEMVPVGKQKMRQTA